MAILPDEPLPAVPAVEPAAPLVEPVEPADGVEPPALLPGDVVAPAAGPLVAVLPATAPEPIRAFVSVKVPVPIARGMTDAGPAVPLVPVAPGVLPLPCRHPVTVIVRLAPAVWLPVVEPDCADMVTAQPSAIANVAPVHTLFIRYLLNRQRFPLCNHNAISDRAESRRTLS